MSEIADIQASRADGRTSMAQRYPASVETPVSSSVERPPHCPAKGSGKLDAETLALV